MPDLEQKSREQKSREQKTQSPATSKDLQAGSRWTSFALALVTVALCLGVAELLLQRVWPISDPYASYKKLHVNRYIPSEFPPGYRVTTRAEPGLPGIEGDKTFSVNNMGFRGDELVTPKPDDEYRIFMIGGSTTECFYLDDSEAVTRILQDSLQTASPGLDVKVYNAGKSGTPPTTTSPCWSIASCIWSRTW